MKKSLLLSAFTAVLSFGAMAQNYYYYKSTGFPAGYTGSAPTDAVTIITGATTQKNVLSSAQAFPFANWSLFGINISQFKASTSGYITFDISQTADDTNNVVLPSTTSPKLAVYGFWDRTTIQNLTLSGNNYGSNVKSWVYGTAPNRVFVVKWSLAHIVSGNALKALNYYSIHFHEQGGFDVVLEQGDQAAAGEFSATIGVQNLDGTIGKQVTGSPNLEGVNPSGNPKTAVVYNFRYGTQPTYDLKVKASLTPEIVKHSTATTIKVAVANNGAQEITGAKMNYSINGGPVVVTGNVSATVGASGGTAEISHPSLYSPQSSAAGTSQTIKVWFTEINAGSSLSDTLTFSMFINNGVSGTKRVLIEEGSGAWCGWCPDGHYRLKEIMAANPGDVIGTVHHNGDGMVNSNSTEFNNTYATGYPYGTVDRKKYDGQDEVGMDRGEWATKAADQLNESTPVNISIINKNFDWATGKVTYTVKVDFVDYAKPGDLRIGTMVLEDKVRGAKGSAFNQTNYFSYEYDPNSGGGPDHPLYTEPKSIIGYWHNEVVRAIPSGPWGTAGVITNPAPGQSYTFTYTHTMQKANSVSYPDESGQDDTEFRSTKTGRGWNKFEDTRLVAFVSYFDADVNKRQVLNVTQTNMINTGVNELTENPIGSVSVYPNPVSTSGSVKFNMNTASDVQVEVINVVGQKVATLANRNYAAGEHTVFFSTENMENGIYFVTVTTAEGKSTYRFVVTK